LAKRVHRDAYAYEGVEIAFAAARRYAFDAQLPDRYEALVDWAADHELKATATQDARYAEALIVRLEGDLDVSQIRGGFRCWTYSHPLAVEARAAVA